MAISCEIISDLIPLCIDGDASEGSQLLVKNHIAECERCRREYEQLQIEPCGAPLTKEEIKLEADPLRKIRVSSIIKLLASVFLTLAAVFVLLIAGQELLNDIPLLHNFFFPIQRADVTLNDEEWTRLTFLKDGETDERDYLLFDSFFTQPKIINAALPQDPGAICVRILDEDGTIIADNIEIKNGTSYEFEPAKKQPCIVEAKAKSGTHRFIINCGS